MLSSTGGEEQPSLNKTNRVSSSSISSPNSLLSSSSTSSSFSNNSSFLLHHQTTTKTMEEVWKDINLASLHDQERILHHPNHTSTFRNMNLQDFLARPFNKDPQLPTTIVSVSTSAQTALYGGGGGCSDHSLVVQPAPATVLSLNSGSEFHLLDNHDPLLIRPNSHLQSQPISNVSSFDSPFDALASSSGLPSFAKKRVPESDSSSGDRRHKRMIKNRESAARSRARKQAYTNELELEVAHLMEENARLKRQQEQLRLAAAAQLPKKQSLHRTSTAPF